MGQVTKEAFEQDKALKEKFGSYDNYKNSFQQDSSPNNEAVSPSNNSVNTNSNGYTINDIVNVAETGVLPKQQGNNSQNSYMEEATRIYNESVESNNKAAASQAASAGAQYREVVRNIGELNKANGRADTGYAEDTSIDAYNAYRNSVNKSYSDANSANNELYSHYMSEMLRLNEERDTDTITGISDIFIRNTGDDGKLTIDGMNEVTKYLTDRYGSLENVPSNVISDISATTGYKQPDNSFDKTQYGEDYYKDVSSGDELKTKEKFLEDNKYSYSQEEYDNYKKILEDSNMQSGSLPQGYSGAYDVKNFGGDYFNVYVNDKKYDLKFNKSSLFTLYNYSELYNKLNNAFPSASDEDIVLYEDDLYVKKGEAWYAVSGSDYNEFKTYYKGRLK